jgi:hypothetical protein
MTVARKSRSWSTFPESNANRVTYGCFDGTAREYIIANPTTLVKWINYIGTPARTI